MTGFKLQRKLLKWVKKTLPEVVAFHPIRSNINGVADIILNVCGDYVAIEVKGEGDRLRPEQKMFIRDIRSTNGWAWVLTDEEFDRCEEYRGVIIAYRSLSSTKTMLSDILRDRKGNIDV